MGVDTGLILGILAFVIAVIGAAAHFSFVSFILDSDTYKAKYLLASGFGNDPSKCPKKFSETFHNPAIFCDNLKWSLVSLAWVSGLIFLVLAIIEILLLLSATKDFVKFASQFTVRGIVYLVLGVPTLGIAGDLGIAAGVLLIVIGIVFVIMGIINN
uniref:Uncharacterized protein n=1 Tax=Coptotermes formosanus TaxID=36987 RepID=R4UV54_COPFO|nr:hypothetical protein [Coptotermes formosanus]